MKYIVAVSGGVDSVVLLDMLSKQHQHELVVAHFDHGIRDDSAADARFVEGLAHRYGLRFEVQREELGAHASEELARARRYQFLRAVAQKYEAIITTAHHQDDIIETIAINVTRGTGWRGLAVLNDKTIERPLLEWSKRDVYDYALRSSLEWVEDATNATDDYLRNRIRRKLSSQLDTTGHTQLLALYASQRELVSAIDGEATRCITTSRYFLTMIDETVAVELLRAILAKASISATRPQRQRLLHAIKTAKPSTLFEVGSGISVEFRQRDFIVKHP